MKIVERRMLELLPQDVKIHDPYWSARLKANSENAIFHQWRMLEASGCIDNFRIAAREKSGLREGWFFADSDATKWLDAASRIERNQHNERLSTLMDDFVCLLGKAQTSDGYLFTYNQIHFPGQRWVNLQIEHELYCHGHLIEAGVSHFEATGRDEMLNIARRAADLLVKDFYGAGPERTPGHEEIEIALLRLWQVTGHEPYRKLAQQFLEQRGRTHLFGFSLIKQFISNGKREKIVLQRQKEYQFEHPDQKINRVPAVNQAIKPPMSQLRFMISGLSGRYFQQHKPIRQQFTPEGHSVRFGYLETAEAMLMHTTPDSELLAVMQKTWERMVTRRMDVSGGLGALPDLEGFGRDYELNPETAYNETCAAIASFLWNWQMAVLTKEAKYSDLAEWQLYNAVSVGMGWQGDSYLYNNPTVCRGGITRQPWYSIPCCPSNLSRTFADLGKYIFGYDEQNLWVQQYFSCTSPLILRLGVQARIESDLPWQENVKVHLQCLEPKIFTLWLRIPSWAGKATVKINGEVLDLEISIPESADATAGGFDPRQSGFLRLERHWQDDLVEIEFEMPVRILHPNPRVKGLRQRAAITRGPLVYCLESVDNPGVDLFDAQVDTEALSLFDKTDLFGGITQLHGRTKKGQDLTYIPYALWGNRGPTQMNVWLKI
ncbi:MAG: glycoside hydrolase family 127 protein [Anaerolineaceae bacterium]